MKILFVTMQFGRSYTQGTERYLSTLGDCLKRRGHTVEYLAGDPLGIDGRRELGEALDSEKGIFAYPSHGWLTVQGLLPERLKPLLERHRPDILHVANPAHVGTGAFQAAEELVIPVVATVMDFWWVCPKATLLRPGGEICDATPQWRECTRCMAATHPRRMVRLLSRVPDALSGAVLGLFHARSLLRGLAPGEMSIWKRRRPFLVERLNAAAHVIFPSRATRDMIAPRLSHDRFSTIPYGLTGDWFAREPGQAGSTRDPAAGTPIPVASLTIGYAGAMLPHKGPHLLLDAVRRLGWTQARLRLAGAMDDAAYAGKLREKAAGLNVEFCGRVPAVQMPAFLDSLDMLAMTSLWPENLPFVVLEAHARGVPVVASAITGVTDQVGDTRLLFEPGSVGGLAQAMEFVRANRADVRPGRVQTDEEMTDATLAVYERALRNRQEHAIGDAGRETADGPPHRRDAGATPDERLTT